MFCVDSKEKQLLNSRVHIKNLSSFLKTNSFLDLLFELRSQFD